MIRARRPLLLLACALALGAGEGAAERKAAIAEQLARLKPTLGSVIDRAKLGEGFKPVIEAKGKSSIGFMFRTMDCEAVAADDFCAPTVTGKPVAADKDAVKAILAVHNLLKAQGIDLIVMPIPNQAMVYGWKLAGAPKEALAWPAYTRTMIHLLEQDVEVVDLLGDYLAVAESDPPMHQYDHHWSPKGIDIAAKALAKRLQRYAFAQQAAAGKAAFTAKDITVNNPTYLFVINGLARRGKKVPVEPAQVTAQQVLRDGKPVAKEDAASPLLLMGDSNLNHLFREGAGMLAHVALETGHVGDRIYQSMAASKVPLEYMRLKHGKSPAKKVVVWCIAGTSFVPQYYGGGWPVVGESGAQSAGPQVTDEDASVVEATVKEVSKVTKGDYATALLGYRVQIGKVLSGECSAKTAIVYEYCIRDHKPAAGAQRKVGEKLKLRLEPWSEAEQRIKGLASEARMDDFNDQKTPWYLGEPAQ